MPSVRNIFVNPRALLLRESMDRAGIHHAVVQVRGLVCSGLCARRVRRALLGLPGIRAVAFQEGPDLFTVTYKGEDLPEEAFRRAVASVVVLPLVRKHLETVGKASGLARRLHTEGACDARARG